MDIATQLMDFQNRQQAINASVEFSQEGKRRAMQKLTTETTTARGAIVRDLQAQWSTWKTKARQNIAGIKQAEADAAGTWDYARLEYMARAVKNQIANTASLADVIGMYAKVKDSGDTHAARAWVETASEAIRGKYSSGEAAVFIKQLTQDATAILDTPKLKELKAEGTSLTSQARALHEVTQKAQAFYNPSTGGMYRIDDEFTAMQKGVQINTRIEPETMGTIVTVDLSED